MQRPRHQMPSVLVLTGNRPERTRGALLLHSRYAVGECPEHVTRWSALLQRGQFPRERQADGSRMPILTWRWSGPTRPANGVRSLGPGER
eukprot:6507682-Pyramimonas_sp.AAC.1